VIFVPAATARELYPYGVFLSESDLTPFLKYPPVQLSQSGSVEPYGPQVAITVLALDPTYPSKQIFISNYDLESGLYGYDGATGNPLVEFAPAAESDPYAGPVQVTAIATEPEPNLNQQHLPVLPYYEIFDEHATGGVTTVLNTMRLLDGAGETLWTSTPVDYAYGGLPSPATSFGTVAADNSQDATFIIDEETFASYGRSGRTGAIAWESDNNYDQQITSPALMDMQNPANAAFVFCRGRLSCQLEKHAVSDGTLLWHRNYLAAYIFPFVATGDVAGTGSDQIVVLGVQGSSPFNVLVHVVDGATGNPLWGFDLGESTQAYGPAPVLADIDGDGVPEILVQTATQLHAVKYGVGELSGWPVQTSTAYTWPVRSEVVVGDLAGDGGQEIVVVSNDSSDGEVGWLDIFDQTGTRRFFPGSLSMYVGPGVTPAIADVDGDGHNELLLGTSIPSGYASLLWPSLWVVDFSLGHPEITHGAVLWSQFGADAQHSAHALDMHAHVAIRPASVSAAVIPGAQSTVPFVIANTGGVSLNWSVAAGVVDTVACSDAPGWLSFSTTSGAIPGAHDRALDLTFDATLLTSGGYDATLCVNSNDTVNGVLHVPVHLDVVNQQYLVDVTVNGGGTITPNVPQLTAAGGIVRFAVSADPDYVLNITGCAGALIGNQYTTAPVTADCTISAAFTPRDRVFADGFDGP
jgi:hypothetical protein